MTHTHIHDGRKVGDLALGIEFECRVSGVSRYDEGRSNAKYETAVNNINGWHAGYDCGFQEVRADPIITLSDAMNRMDALLNVLDSMGTQYGWTQGTGIMGMHVHINVEDPRYGSLDAECLFDTYVSKYQHQAEALTRATKRIEERNTARARNEAIATRDKAAGRKTISWSSANHCPIPAQLRWADVIEAREDYSYNPFSSKGWDFSPRMFEEWPTIEMRTWDSTGDRGLLRARFDMIRSMAVDTVHLMKKRGKVEMELAPNSRIRTHATNYGISKVEADGKVEVMA